MEIRQAVSSQIPALCQVRKLQLIDEGQRPDCCIDEALEEFFTQGLLHDTLFELVALDGEKIAATGAVCFFDYPPSFINPTGKTAYLTNMYTDPAYRGRGLASQILQQLIREAARRKVRVIRLVASTAGSPIYHRFGFHQSGEWLTLELPEGL